MEFRKLYFFLKPYAGLCILSGLGLLLFTALGIPLPWFLKMIIDEALSNRSDKALLFLLLGCVAVNYILREIMFYISHYLFYYTGARTLFGVRVKLFKHLQTLSLRFYQEYRTGKLISNILTDVAMLNGMISGVLANLVIHLFTIVCILIALFLMSPKLSILCLILLPLQLINFTFFRRRMQRDSSELRERMSEVSASLSETINGVKVVKSFGKELQENRGFVEMLRPTFDLLIDLNMKSVYSWMAAEALNVSCIIAALAWGGCMVISQEITVGVLVAYYTYLGMLTAPISALSNLAITISDGMTSVERIFKLLSAVPEITESEDAQDPGKVTGHLSFRHVDFGYKKDRMVLRDFCLDVEPGTKVALVGPSGSGKSTIASILMRFYDVSGGEVLIDGLDVRKFTRESLHNNVGIVLQESFLFSGTIEDNIRYGTSGATHEQVISAAKMANAHDFIMEMPKGYKSTVGENGATLSGGQKQRIAIARAILKNPSVLILDEATSALDTLSEGVVQEALDRLMQGRTSLIIAHRLSTVRNADLIVVLQNGVIAQKGTHSELLMQPGIYRDLYAKQMQETNPKDGLFSTVQPPLL